MKTELSRRSLLVGSAALVGAGFSGNRVFSNTGVELAGVNVVGESLGTVPRHAFGLNVLADRDDIWGTYGDRIDSFRPTMLRWPGGEISHRLWDDNGNVNNNLLTFLRQFIRYCRNRDITPTIVLPGNWEFVTSRGRLDRRRYRRGVRQLIRTAERAMGGRDMQIVWELGNEPYCDCQVVRHALLVNTYMSVIEYFRPNDLIAVVAGPPTRLIAEWAEQFSTMVDSSRYDLIRLHSYPNNHFIYTVPHIETARRYLGDKPAYFSEWNHFSCWDPAWGWGNVECVSSEDFESRTFGISAAGAMVKHFATMIQHRMWGASFWGVQQNTMNNMFPLENMRPEQPPYVTGHVFGWLRETEGMDLVSVSEVDWTEDHPAHFAFANENRVYLFIDARNATGDYWVTIEGFEFSNYWGERISGENDVKDLIPTVNRAEAVRWGNRIQVPLRVETSHELIRITLTR